ncbi:hypothetical protein GIB67_007022 [Kingdonia uniflora]|uniref:Transposase n=1 Tax=Kingdonia uniflora TaxID=39325 RepID=A0A7J7NZ87_9MAGN|nr:hypothetical protein GIB67_007022 [Kingdonia uniflora]
MISEEEDLDYLPKVYHCDKEINPDGEQERWVRYAQDGIDYLGDEDGYYSTHSYDNEDYVPTAKDLERGNEFESVDVELDEIYSKEEDDKAKTPLTVGFKEFEVGMQWATVYEAREHMRRLRLKCLEEEYEWLVFISRNNDGHTMILRHGNFQHSCEGKLGVDSTLCNQPWVVREVEALVRDVMAMTPKAIKTRMKTQYGAEISYWTAWNARLICMESIVGSYDQGYHKLPSFCVEILKSNPGSIARTWRQDDTLQWTGTLVAFKASLNGFVKGFRPIMGTDGCFFKREIWSGKMTFISDRQKGLIDSVAEIFPHANHRFYFRHMFKNIKKYHKGAHLERLSWGDAKAFRQNKKQEFLNQLGIDIPEAKDYLEKEPYEHWCRSHFDCTTKCEHITNNFSESFNWWMMKIIDKPLTKAFERLSFMLMKLMFVRRSKVESWDLGVLVPKAVKHLEYLVAHYGEYDMEGGDKNECV